MAVLEVMLTTQRYYFPVHGRSLLQCNGIKIAQREVNKNAEYVTDGTRKLK